MLIFFCELTGRDVLMRLDCSNDFTQKIPQCRCGKYQPPSALSTCREKNFRLISPLNQRRVASALLVKRLYDGLVNLVDDKIGQYGPLLNIEGPPLIVGSD